MTSNRYEVSKRGQAKCQAQSCIERHRVEVYAEKRSARWRSQLDMKYQREARLSANQPARG